MRAGTAVSAATASSSPATMASSDQQQEGLPRTAAQVTHRKAADERYPAHGLSRRAGAAWPALLPAA
jgi:hypothetical protein